jgi:hypothetical protein
MTQEIIIDPEDIANLQPGKIIFDQNAPQGAVEGDAYSYLALVLANALEQASHGKGKERHASEGEPFDKQPICEMARRYGLGGPLFQANKKMLESQRLPWPAAERELLGAINYIAAAIIVGGERNQ